MRVIADGVEHQILQLVDRGEQILAESSHGGWEAEFVTGGRSERDRDMPKTAEQNQRLRIKICSGVRHKIQDKDKETGEVLNNARVVAKIQKSDVNSDSSCGSVWDWDWFRLRLRQAWVGLRWLCFCAGGQGRHY
ncbi:unnamed protein product [Fusarium graminearum]|nr:unnamed protein product [Fusarium graminearum]CAG1990009.1 unnamed protein product [Fusarium graminearum]VTO87943.1 unnamed protein product [Fusarium graminearum]